MLREVGEVTTLKEAQLETVQTYFVYGRGMVHWRGAGTSKNRPSDQATPGT